MAKRFGLGRGLDALIPSGDEKTEERDASFVSTSAIIPNPRQPRDRIDEESLQELANSIREHGVIQPLLVTGCNEPGKYTLIAGERRWRAAQMAGLQSVPVIIRQATDQEQLELALIENVQRADLTPLEMAEAFRQLAEEFKLSHEEIATRVGKSRVAVTNTLRLLKLPLEIQQALVDGKISEGHARVLLQLATQNAQIASLDTIIKNDLTVRETEELVRRMSGEKTTKPAPVEVPSEIRSLEENLREHFGTKVNIRHQKDRGAITIHYYSNEELDHLVYQLMKE